jgi:hypothetical protein
VSGLLGSEFGKFFASPRTPQAETKLLDLDPFHLFRRDQ